MGCISQLRRGTRYRLGAWALIRPPTVEAWHEACLRPFSRKREAQLRDGHHRALKVFLRTVAHEHPQLIGLIFADKGVAALRLADLLTWLLGRDEAWVRREFPSGDVCLGYHVPGPFTPAWCRAWTRWRPRTRPGPGNDGPTTPPGWPPVRYPLRAAVSVSAP